MKHKHLYTTTELFDLVVKQLRNEGRFPDLILDYVLATDTVLEFRNYEFSVLGSVNYGASEGIYVKLFCVGNIGYGWDKQHIELGTVKSLSDNDDTFRRMAMLMADFQIAATRFVNSHLDDFTWLGYDLDYYRAGEAERSYGVTMKGIRSFDDAIEEAKRTMRRFSYYVKVVITRNSDGKTKTVYGNEDKMRYFVISLEEDPENALRGAYDRDVCIRGVRKPSAEEAEVFTELDRKQIGGHELHVANVEEVPRAEVMQSFDIDNVDASSVFGVDFHETSRDE